MTKWFTFTNERGTFDTRNFHIYINKIKRPLMPPLKTPTIEVGQMAGAWAQKSSFGTYEITIDLMLYSDTDALLRKDLRTMALSIFAFKAGKLTLSDEQDVYVNAVLTDKFDFDNFSAIGEGSLTFLIADPFAYKLTELNPLIDDVAKKITVTVDGYDTFPRFRIYPTGAQSSIKITNETTGKYLLLEGTMATGVVLIADHKKNLVYEEANLARRMTLVNMASDFFPLVKGSNTISYTATTNAMSIRMFYTERYL